MNFFQKCNCNKNVSNKLVHMVFWIHYISSNRYSKYSYYEYCEKMQPYVDKFSFIYQNKKLPKNQNLSAIYWKLNFGTELTYTFQPAFSSMNVLKSESSLVTTQICSNTSVSSLYLNLYEDYFQRVIIFYFKQRLNTDGVFPNCE